MQINRVSAFETVNLISIPGWVEPITLRIDIVRFPAYLTFSVEQAQCDTSTGCGRQVRR